MVERGRGPGSGGVAGATIGAKAALVVVILGVAGVAVLRRGLEVCQTASVQVATAADGLGVLADQFESLLVVIEVASIGVNPIVTGQAVAAES